MPSSGDAEIAAILAEACGSSGVPAMAAAVVRGSGLERVAAAGYRKRGAAAAATLDDLWHLGSDTKAMTAILAATYVDEGKLRWDSTVAEVFPELAGSFRREYAGVTLSALLSHRSGLPENLGYGYIANSADPREQRLSVVKKAFSSRPANAPGSSFQYSNLGYITAGAMLERVGGADWETLIRLRIFEPLGMESAGFGGLGRPGRIDQPWGHRDLSSKPGPEGADIDNPPVLGPAGRVHCSIQDWAKFIADQLRGARGEGKLVSPESYRYVQEAHYAPETSEAVGYALGWAIVDRDWAGGKALSHAGSNTYYYCVAWLAPERDFALLVCANAGLDAAAAVDSATGRIIEATLLDRRP